MIKKYHKILCKLILGCIYFSSLYGMDEDVITVNTPTRKATKRKTAHREAADRKKGQFRTRKIGQLEDEDKRYVLCVIDAYYRLRDGTKTIDRVFKILNEEYKFPLESRKKITTITAWFLEKLQKEDYQQFFDETAQLLKVYAFTGKETYPDKKNDIASPEKFREILLDIACKELKKEEIFDPYRVKSLRVRRKQDANRIKENSFPLRDLHTENRNNDSVMYNAYDVPSENKNNGLIGEEFYSNVLKNSSIDIFNLSGATYYLKTEEGREDRGKPNVRISDGAVTTEYMIVDDPFYIFQPYDSWFNY